MQVVGSFDYHKRDNDAEVYLTPASALSLSSWEDSMFQLLCSEPNCRIEESKAKLYMKEMGGNTEGPIDQKAGKRAKSWARVCKETEEEE